MESASQVGAGRKEEVDIVNDIVSGSSVSFDVFSTILVLFSTLVLFSLASKPSRSRKEKDVNFVNDTVCGCLGSFYISSMILIPFVFIVCNNIVSLIQDLQRL